MVTVYPMTAAPPAVPIGVGSPAVEEAMRQQAAALLQHTYRWLENAVPAAPPLAGVIAPLVAAVQLYQAERYAACLRQVTAVVGGLQQARWAFPTLPPL